MAKSYLKPEYLSLGLVQSSVALVAEGTANERRRPIGFVVVVIVGANIREEAAAETAVGLLVEGDSSELDAMMCVSIAVRVK